MLVMVIISLVFLFIYVLLSKGLEDKEMRVSPYECGFDVISETRVNFSYRFFLISILFLIFDVEISLLFPLPFLLGRIIVILGRLIFLVVLMVGLVYEYKNGALEWL